MSNKEQRRMEPDHARALLGAMAAADALKVSLPTREENREAARRLTYLASDGSLWHGDLSTWSPDRGREWCATHDDFDGPGDDRHVCASTRAELPAAVERWIEESRS